ncbi:MAG: helix-turn-helix transcriptional regulator [Acidimicrobiales bacterium]
MGDTPGRMLELLALLQARTTWGGAELARRLEVTERTVRRDVERLRLLGYPVAAAPGRYGGYQLGRGGRLPPLLLNDDEAAAVAIGLRAAVDGTVAGLEEPALSTLAKLDHLLPAAVAQRVRALHGSTASMLWAGAGERVDAACLILLARGCASSRRVRFDYTDRSGAVSNRLVEPFRLVRSGPRWYLVARDTDRDAWRTFRLDRIVAPVAVGTPFEVVDPPDAVAMVTEGISVRSYPFQARIRIPLPVEEATRLVPRTIAVVEAEAGSTLADLGAPSMGRMVAYLAGLDPPCEVLDPPGLRAAILAHARAVAVANSSPAATRVGRALPARKAASRASPARADATASAREKPWR